MAVTTLPDGVYIVGGFDSSRRTPSEKAFKLVLSDDDSGDGQQRLTVQRVADMRISRESLLACSASACNAIYAVGGVTDKGKVTHVVEKYSV